MSDKTVTPIEKQLPIGELIPVDDFKTSIGFAFEAEFDSAASLKRLQGMLNNLPEKKLYSRKHNLSYSYYVVEDGHQRYIPKSEDELYNLARAMYLRILIRIIQTIHDQKTGSSSSVNSLIHNRVILIRELFQLIDNYDAGHLDLSRIVLTQKQYKWYYSNFRRKKIYLPEAQYTERKVPVRSRSEQGIGNRIERLVFVYHFEEQMRINVRPLVDALEKKLLASGKLKGLICEYQGGVCYWNVPPELESMNAVGSVWKSYDIRTGCITIYPDFKIILADGEKIIWEHEGLFNDFIYRFTSSERIGLMKYTDTVKEENLITTFERDVDGPEKIDDIIRRRVLPRLWF